MSDRRRRRKCVSDNSEMSDGSGDEKEEKDVKDVVSDVGEHEDGETDNKSEYESAEEEDVEASGDENLAGKEQNALSDEGLQGDHESDQFEERQQGDGQESSPSQERPLDDDEDRRNPQYIPKKGTFYEHDDRTAGETKVSPVETARPASKGGEEQKKKKVWKDEDCWVHDKFIENEQIPKSRDELVAMYGYDIRSEDCAPRARRRRRYGRGPNKYTRTWEDVNAYKKQATPRSRSKSDILSPKSRLGSSEKDDFEDSREDFPELNLDGVTDNKSPENYRNEINKKRDPDEFQRQSASAPKWNEPRGPRRNDTAQYDKNKRYPRENYRIQKENVKSEPIDFDKSDKGRTRNARSAYNSEMDRYDDQAGGDVIKNKKGIVNQSFASSRAQEKLPKKAIRGGTNAGHPTSDRRLNSIPPRLQDTANRPKRYSSLRQRGATDSSTYAQEPAYYDQNYQNQVYQENGASAPGAPSSHVPLSNTASYSPQFPSPPPYTDSYIPRSLPNIPTPPSTIFTPSGGHATQPIVPTAYIPTNGSVLNYGPPAAPFPPPQYAFQGYAPQVQVSQPQEIFSNGVAYYSPQPQLAGRVPQKRPKAAIPILPPPDNGYMHDQGAYLDGQEEAILYEGQYEYSEQCGPPHLVPCQPLQICEPDQTQPIYEAQAYLESNIRPYLDTQQIQTVGSPSPQVSGNQEIPMSEDQELPISNEQLLQASEKEPFEDNDKVDLASAGASDCMNTKPVELHSESHLVSSDIPSSTTSSVELASNLPEVYTTVAPEKVEVELSEKLSEVQIEDSVSQSSTPMSDTVEDSQELPHKNSCENSHTVVDLVEQVRNSSEESPNVPCEDTLVLPSQSQPTTNVTSEPMVEIASPVALVEDSSPKDSGLSEINNSCSLAPSASTEINDLTDNNPEPDPIPDD